MERQPESSPNRGHDPTFARGHSDLHVPSGGVFAFGTARWNRDEVAIVFF